MECILAYAVSNGSNFIFFHMAIQLSHYCFLNSPPFPLWFEMLPYYTKLYVLTIFICYKFHMWVDLFPDSILSHCHCQYQNDLTMEVLLYILISDMPTSLFRLFFCGIPGYSSCSFFQVYFIYTQRKKLMVFFLLIIQIYLLGKTDNFMMLSLLIQVNNMCPHLFTFFVS